MDRTGSPNLLLDILTWHPPICTTPDKRSASPSCCTRSRACCAD